MDTEWVPERVYNFSDMDRKQPLHYPGPIPKKRSFNPRKLIPRAGSRAFLFDAVFSHRIVRERIRPILLHGIVLTLIGSALVATGHSSMFVRSLATCVCVICLSLEVAVWISATKWIRQYKAIVFCTATCIFGTSAMGIMYWSVLSTLEDQQNEVFSKLMPTISVPRQPYGGVLDSTFTITNGGSIAIGPNHQLVCGVNLITFEGGNRMANSEQMIRQTIPFPIQPGGDSQSDPCLEQIFGGARPTCIDMNFDIFYTLETQPEDNRQKEFRFTAQMEDGFVWHPQPLKMSGSPCTRYLTPLTPPRGG